MGINMIFLKVIILVIGIVCSNYALSMTQTEMEDFFQEFDDLTDQEAVSDILNKADYDERVIPKVTTPWEKKAWYQYHPIFLDSKRRLELAIEFYEEYQSVLEDAEKKYGVEKEIILAILGIESFYGNYMGKYNVLDTLYTLAYHYPKRSRFFKQELYHFIQLSLDIKWDVDDIKGSYAGAMGWSQFISSSYRHFAHSYKEGEAPNLIDSPEDAIFSVANYFKKHNWNINDKVAQEIDLPYDSIKDFLWNGKRPTLQENDLAHIDQLDDYIDEDDRVNFIRLKESEHETKNYILYHNFYVISRYNHSPLYAMVVFELSQKIKNSIE